MIENRIPEKTQQPAEGGANQTISPEDMDAISAGTMFQPGSNRCIKCGQVFSDPIRYASHLADHIKNGD